MAATIELLNTYKEQLAYEKTVQLLNDEIILLGNRENNITSFTSDFKCTQQTIINSENASKYTNFAAKYYNDFNVLPDDIESVQVIDKRNNIVLNTINSDIQLGEPLYRVGLISDVHYNDTDTDDNPDTYYDDGAEYSEDLINSLTVFNNAHVDFISCGGDISTDNVNHLQNFRRCFDKYGHNMAFYTCVGNHDTVLKARNKNEWMQTDNINDKYNITRFNDTDGTSFYFVKELDATHKDVYIYLNLEYGWNSNQTYNTHDCRLVTSEELLHEKDLTYDDKHLYNTDTILEFERILEEFKNDRCFIFTHIMFQNAAGTYHDTDFYNYYKTHNDVMRGDQGDYLYELLNKYDNNYWFCGHSHYKWSWQELDKNINITKTNNSYNIHLPSLSRPLPFGIKSYTTAQKDSEGAIMDVYQDYVVIRGYVFKEESVDGPTNEKLIAYNGPMYKLMVDDLASTDPEHIIITEVDNKINITIKGVSTNVIANFKYNNSDNYKTHDIVLRFSDVYITNEDGEDITDMVLAEQKIGFRDNTTDVNQWYYYFVDNHIYTLDYNGVIFKMSSTSRFIGQTIHIQFNCRYAFVENSQYVNKINPIAIYKL